MSYALFKGIHLTTVAVTLALFLLRGTWMMLDSDHLNSRWVRVLPHINDVLLLLSAIVLTIMLNQYPFTQGWLTAKFFALILYIVLGTVALKRGSSKPLRISAWLAALGVFTYMVAVAVNHEPMPWL